MSHKCQRFLYIFYCSSACSDEDLVLPREEKKRGGEGGDYYINTLGTYSDEAAPVGPKL